MKNKINALVVLAVLAAAAFYNCKGHSTNKSFEPAEQTAVDNSPQTEVTPEPAAPSEESGTNQVSSSDAAPKPMMCSPIPEEKQMKREGYSVSYNVTTREPNYVSWVLTPDRLLGHAKRSPKFYEDPELEDDEKSTLDDYRSSGYDRGHMCPAGDNKWSLTAMIETFYLSNICPQKHALNDGDWKELEEACRDWVSTSGESIYIVSGPIFDTNNSKMLKRHVRVPDRFFKVLLCLNKNDEKGIAFVYHNNSEQHPMDYYVCSIDDVEKITGYDFFPSLSKNLQDKLEKQTNLTDWK